MSDKGRWIPIQTNDLDSLYEDRKSLQIQVSEQQAEIERLRAKLADYDHQAWQIAETCNGDARDVPEPYEQSLAGRVKYEIERLRAGLARIALGMEVGGETAKAHASRVLGYPNTREAWAMLEPGLIKLEGDDG